MTNFSSFSTADLSIGQSVSATRVADERALTLYAHSCGDQTVFAEIGGDRTVPEAWVLAQVAALVTGALPGPGARITAQSMAFQDPIPLGVSIEVTLTVQGLEGDVVTLEATVEGGSERLAEGRITATAPTRSNQGVAPKPAGVTLHEHRHFDALIEEAKALDPLPTAVVCPESPDALLGAVLGHEAGLIRPVFVGSTAKIEAAAKAGDLDLGGIEIIAIDDHAEAAKAAVGLVREGRATALMKGHLHTDVLLRAVLNRETGIRTDRRLSHVFVMDVPGVERPLIMSDCAINVAPDLETKIAIAQNAIDVAQAIGVDEPKVAVMSAVETPMPGIPSSMEAAEIAKLAAEGRITGGPVAGPLAMDNAVDLGAAETKGLTGPVAGRADVLVMPNIEAGNIAYKELTFLAKAKAAGVVLGAQAPVILTSRADDAKARLASCAVTSLYAHHTGSRPD